jgi:hypothetical protein
VRICATLLESTIRSCVPWRWVEEHRSDQRQFNIWVANTDALFVRMGNCMARGGCRDQRLAFEAVTGGLASIYAFDIMHSWLGCRKPPSIFCGRHLWEQSDDYWAAQNGCMGSGCNRYLDTPKLVLEVEKEGTGTCLLLCLLTVDGNRP